MKQPGSMRRRAFFSLVVSCLLFTSSAGFSTAATSDIGTDGLVSSAWVGRGGPDDIVFLFWIDSDGDLSGEAHTIRGGRHMTQSPAISIEWDGLAIEATMNTGAVLKGKYDRSNRTIDGAIFYNGAKVVDMPLRGVAASSVSGLPARQEPVYSYTVPEETGDGWISTDPDGVGLDSSVLEALVEGVIEGRAGLIHSLLIARGGKLVLEEYFHGHGRDDLHRIASVTKSVASLITGIAIDRGEIKSVDALLAGFFPRLKGDLKDKWQDVRLKDLLTMSTGTEWSEDEADRTHGTGPEFFKRLFAKDFSSSPGEKWQYVSANVNLLSGVIREATGKHADQFADRHLFGPLGIESWNWDYGSVDGHRLMDGSLQLRPRDMAKIGAMVATGGSWNGQQVVSKEWIEESISPIIETSGPEKYGYLWWNFYIPVGDSIQEAVVANGRGSQFIIIFPVHDLVVVTTGSNDENGMQFAIGRVLSEYLLGGL